MLVRLETVDYIETEMPRPRPQPWVSLQKSGYCHIESIEKAQKEPQSYMFKAPTVR